MKQNKKFAELSAQEKKSVNGGLGCVPENPYGIKDKDGNIELPKLKDILGDMITIH